MIDVKLIKKVRELLIEHEFKMSNVLNSERMCVPYRTANILRDLQEIINEYDI